MNPQFERLLNRFEEYMQSRGFSLKTIPDYLHNVEIFLTYLTELEIKEITEVDRQILSDYQVRILDHTYRGKTIGVATKSRRLSILRSFFHFLLKESLITNDPTVDLELPKRPKMLPKNILTKKEMSALLEVPDLKTPLGIRNRAILEVFYSTGIRVSELCNLTLNDVDTARGELRVNQGKNAKDRIVPLGEVACDYIDLYLRNARKLLAPSEPSILFVTKNGKRFRYTNLSYLITHLGQKARLKKHIACHSLRHTCATHLLQGRADIRYIQEILGHRSLATTQVYTKVEITDLKKIHHRCHPRERKEVQVNDGWT